MKLILPDDTKTFDLGDGASVSARKPDTAEIRAIRERHTKKTWKKGQPVTETDWDTVAVDTLDLIITGWTGITDAKGQPLVCERAVKPYLPQDVVAELRRWALEGRDDDDAGKH